MRGTRRTYGGVLLIELPEEFRGEWLRNGCLNSNNMGLECLESIEER